MTYSIFKEKCAAGTQVTDGERNGEVVKISQEMDKALVRFSDGTIEWLEYYRIDTL